MRGLVLFWAWTLTTTCLVLAIPLLVAMGSPAVRTVPVQSALACALPLFVGMSFRSAVRAMNGVGSA